MSFSVEDQYQQFLYPEAINAAREEMYNIKQSSTTHAPLKRPRNSIAQPSKPRVQKSAIKKDQIKILLLNKKNNVNMDLLRFFKKNLLALNQRGNVFDWITVEQDELTEYSEQGITRFPALVSNNTKIIGTEQIIRHLTGGASKTSKTRSAAVQTTGDIDVQQYLRDIVKVEDDGYDEEEDFGASIQQKANEMNRKRQKFHQHKVSAAAPELHDRKKTRTKRRPPKRKNTTAVEVAARHDTDDDNDNDADPGATDPLTIIGELPNGEDDDMIARYFENQQETEL